MGALPNPPVFSKGPRIEDNSAHTARHPPKAHSPVAPRRLSFAMNELPELPFLSRVSLAIGSFFALLGDGRLAARVQALRSGAPLTSEVPPPAPEAALPDRPGTPATPDARGSTMMSLAGVPAKTIVWRCGATEGSIHHDNPNRRIVLQVPGKGPLTWPQIGAVSGLRYGDDGPNEFWMRGGKDARLTVAGRKYATCVPLGR